MYTGTLMGMAKSAVSFNCKSRDNKFMLYSRTKPRSTIFLHYFSTVLFPLVLAGQKYSFYTGANSREGVAGFFKDWKIN
jgi:hypothetical protein